MTFSAKALCGQSRQHESGDVRAHESMTSVDVVERATSSSSYDANRDAGARSRKKAQRTAAAGLSGCPVCRGDSDQR